VGKNNGIFKKINIMKKIIKKLFRWIFEEEIQNFQNKQKQIEGLKVTYQYQKKQIDNIISQLKNTIGNIDVSVDVHESPYSESWAVISIQGKPDYVKFLNLGHSDLMEIKRFLRKFDRCKIDATPKFTNFLRID
jgi:hypothetical protein